MVTIRKLTSPQPERMAPIRLVLVACRGAVSLATHARPSSFSKFEHMFRYI